MYKIALVEDDMELCNTIEKILKKYKYNILKVIDFENVEEVIFKEKPDLILLDINLPYYDGFHICRNIRKKSTIPIIITSARNSNVEQVMGLEFGADDYVVKPFAMDILHAKIKSCLRRVYGEYTTKSQNVSIGGFVIDTNTFIASYMDEKTELTKNELKLILSLVENKNKVVSRETLLKELWDDKTFIDDNTLSVNISRIKTKLELLGIKDAIKTKRGVGYSFVSEFLEG
ncbi:response regulator transcription factor [Oceanirhabdus sp. W0125-5]|uniref:response regulator transcription factor n=1 Tax=Oceanirhabdus sp. W0125-5 TaxID=2999116 RepID=UPI0022F304B1|nr:response regulator transcription factor [Oceanirhabdus sp. W0125-5]WBW96747.1 response regulator transcription factor [Oceanirhabdus sp. W0125-5]